MFAMSQPELRSMSGEDLQQPDRYEAFNDEECSVGIGLLEPHRDASITEKLEGPADSKSPRSSILGVRRPSNLAVWITLNIFATIGIVFVNKAIFNDPSFRDAQLSFASFHFFITFATLHVVSMSRFGFFERRKAKILDVVPLAGAMCLNVVLPNLSLAHSSVTFYQTARVLLTPVVAILNYILFRMTIPRQAAYTLVPVCFGVAMVTYYDVKPGAESKNTSNLGVASAMAGVVASSVYTVWIAYFHKKLEMTSVQLLHNQALLGAVVLLYVVPFVDTLPIFAEVALNKWLMIIMASDC